MGVASLGTRETWEEVGVEELEEEADLRERLFFVLEKREGEESEKWVKIRRAQKTGYTREARTGHGGSPMNAIS